MNEKFCVNCKLYNGDCGHHEKDIYNHIDYMTPKDKARDEMENCKYYEDSRSMKDIVIEELNQCTDISIECREYILKAIMNYKE